MFVFFCYLFYFQYFTTLDTDVKGYLKLQQIIAVFTSIYKSLPKNTSKISAKNLFKNILIDCENRMNRGSSLHVFVDEFKTLLTPIMLHFPECLSASSIESAIQSSHRLTILSTLTTWRDAASRMESNRARLRSTMRPFSCLGALRYAEGHRGSRRWGVAATTLVDQSIIPINQSTVRDTKSARSLNHLKNIPAEVQVNNIAASNEKKKKLHQTEINKNLNIPSIQVTKQTTNLISQQSHNKNQGLPSVAIREGKGGVAFTDTNTNDLIRASFFNDNNFGKNVDPLKQSDSISWSGAAMSAGDSESTREGIAFADKKDKYPCLILSSSFNDGASWMATDYKIDSINTNANTDVITGVSSDGNILTSPPIGLSEALGSTLAFLCSTAYGLPHLLYLMASHTNPFQNSLSPVLSNLMNTAATKNSRPTLQKHLGRNLNRSATVPTNASNTSANIALNPVEVVLATSYDSSPLLRPPPPPLLFSSPELSEDGGEVIADDEQATNIIQEAAVSASSSISDRDNFTLNDNLNSDGKDGYHTAQNPHNMNWQRDSESSASGHNPNIQINVNFLSSLSFRSQNPHSTNNSNFLGPTEDPEMHTSSNRVSYSVGEIQPKPSVQYTPLRHSVKAITSHSPTERPPSILGKWTGVISTIEGCMIAFTGGDSSNSSMNLALSRYPAMARTRATSAIWQVDGTLLGWRRKEEIEFMKRRGHRQEKGIETSTLKHAKQIMMRHPLSGKDLNFNKYNNNNINNSGPAEMEKLDGSLINDGNNYDTVKLRNMKRDENESSNNKMPSSTRLLYGVYPLYYHSNSPSAKSTIQTIAARFNTALHINSTAASPAASNTNAFCPSIVTGGQFLRANEIPPSILSRILDSKRIIQLSPFMDGILILDEEGVVHKLSLDGSLFTFGRRSVGGWKFRAVSHIATGPEHAMFLGLDGKVRCLGRNKVALGCGVQFSSGDESFNGLGNVKKTSTSMSTSKANEIDNVGAAVGGVFSNWDPHKIGTIPWNFFGESINKSKIRKVFCSHSSTAFLTEFGQLFMQGDGETGLMGDGHAVSRLTPCPIPFFENRGEAIVEMAMGACTAAALTASGSVFIWGRTSLMGLNKWSLEAKYRTWLSRERAREGGLENDKFFDNGDAWENGGEFEVITHNENARLTDGVYNGAPGCAPRIVATPLKVGDVESVLSQLRAPGMYHSSTPCLAVNQNMLLVYIKGGGILPEQGNDPTTIYNNPRNSHTPARFSTAMSSQYGQ